MEASLAGMDGSTDVSATMAGVRAVEAYNIRRFDLLQQAKRYRLPILAIWGVAATAAVVLIWDYDWLVSLALAVGGTLLVRPLLDWPRRQLQWRVHSALLHAVLTGIDDVTVAYGQEPESLFWMPGNLFVKRNRMTYRLVLTGTCQGFSFTIAEADFEIWDDEALITALSAIIVCFSQVSPFPGDFAAVEPPPEKRVFWSRLPKGLFELESADGQGMHKFLTDVPDVATARMPGMISALETIRKGWPDGLARFAIRRQQGYLVLPSAPDRLRLPDLGQGIDYDLDVKPLLEHLRHIIALAKIASRV
ncbi:hypothetical protein [Rhizobium sp. RU36D]|uniref:hypothetical protein n=1 Tax=Rhizobium sp. RU36D TaxID=1907415 RepID=UPI0009D87996|nr:hypothetical protein [Rhizobium sp. RU36D]SMD14571.1 hypothetical protein SAMN05880593_12647 [Rhizobium sp. RU36D]